LTTLLKRFVLLLFCVLLLPATMLKAEDDPVAEVLRQGLEGVEIDPVLSVGACRVSSWPVLPALYERHDYRPFWTDPEAVDQFVDAIRKSYDEGLNPMDYHLPEILDLLEQKTSIDAPDPALTASLDLLLTDAFIRLASHSMFGREDPATHHPQWKIEHAPGENPVDYFEKALTYPSVAQIVDSWKVHYEYYETLKKALAYYRTLRARGGWRRLPENKPLAMGSVGPDVLALRRRIAFEYPWLGISVDYPVYDDGLSKAVRYFQARHGVQQNGAAGRETLLALNVSVDVRIDQIRINLERSRWVLRDLGDRFVMVDVAGYNVYLQDNGRIVWSGRAQVGKPYRDTPVLRSQITDIELNPTWTIPPTVRDEDVLPEVKKDRGYLKRHDIVIIDKEGLGIVIPPKEVNWKLYPNPDDPFPYRLVQVPGPSNPLGRIKILFPNEQRVFLHDTPSKDLFDRSERTFSSGCIRVERPFELAGLLLGDIFGWNTARLKQAAGRGETVRIDLPMPVTILIMYSTVIVDRNGVAYFRKDLYNRDPAMMEEMGHDPRVIPGG
jgi:L,D-transpeptidase YcbB